MKTEDGDRKAEKKTTADGFDFLPTAFYFCWHANLAQLVERFIRNE